MKKIKSIIIFIIILLLYFIPAFLFKIDKAYYNSLNKPIYAPKDYIFAGVWPILYIIFSLYITLKISKNNFSKELIIYFIINYVISFFFNKVFFIDKNLFLSFAVTFASFISGLFIFITSFKNKNKEFSFFIPYIIWTIYASILMANIYLIN